MSIDEFWNVVAEARDRAVDPSDAEEVAEQMLTLLTAMPPERVAGLAQPLWDLRACSYGWELWQAAYLINGGCSDDGYEPAAGSP